MDFDVIIVGAGPTGLMLAAELRLAGASVLVLERLAAPTGLSKALAIQGRGVDYLAMRGLLARLEDRAPPLPVHAGLLHFGLIPLNLAGTSLGPKGIFVPQSTTEAVLEARALELGAEFIRGLSLTGLAQDDVSATLEASDGATAHRFNAKFVVGCDGAHSAVRKLAGIAFPGADATALLRLGDVKLDPASPAPPFLVPIGDGYLRLITKEPFPAGFDNDSPMDLDELRASAHRVFGFDVPIVEARWLSRFTDTTRQAEQYRMRRVFLAGDAAHVHLPAGGPGILTGMGDAVNLGWKLGAVLRGERTDELLDTYHRERHPVGRAVIVHTQAQAALTVTDAHGQAMREIMQRLVGIPAVVEHLLRMLWQLDTRYPVGEDSHPRLGTFIDDVDVMTPEGPGRLYEHLTDGRGLWLSGNLAFEREPLLQWHSTRVRRLRFEPDRAALDATAVLVRPDGHIAWASAETALSETARASLAGALERWFGSGARPTPTPSGD